ncbi:MAG TPA: DUF1592 domain-containing protein [Bryobacteraceae bacterium]|nr:DUF1592 domain-containing protein [Bryobacteraceae bacterium]
MDLAELARRAYRRPVTDDELDRLVRFVRMAEERGDSFEQGMRVALEAILVSPQFLFRMEHEPEASEAAGTRGIDDFELATRLSYFLWSSMPDEELFRLAAQNRLSDPAVLTDQVQRMLLSPKSRSLVESFGGQWLELRNLDSLKPDPYKFSAFDQDLRLAMKLETQEFFESIIHEDRPILDFINANYTFLNARLAKFYGIPGVEGDEFRRVELRNMPQRGGLLGQASVLTVSSYPTRTSPVLRGKWILENLLNAPPPPPPPDVPNLDDHANATASMREQLEQHRKNPTCAACHARMDPLGFGLENYDAIGRWRTRDGKLPIDASGTLPNGKSFSGPSDLKQILLADKDTFTKCLASKLLTYALGRGLEASDRATVESIASETAAGGYRFSQLILAIVNSPSFQMRRGEVQ